MDDREKRIEDGKRAKELAADPILRVAVNGIVKDCMVRLTDAAIGSDAAMAAHAELKAANSLMDQLKVIENEGLIAASKK